MAIHRKSFSELVKEQKQQRLNILLHLTDDEKARLTRALEEQKEFERLEATSPFKCPHIVLQNLATELMHKSLKLVAFVESYDYKKFMDYHKEQILRIVVKELLYKFRSPRHVRMITDVEELVSSKLQNYYDWVY